MPEQNEVLDNLVEFVGNFLQTCKNVLDISAYDDEEKVLEFVVDVYHALNKKHFELLQEVEVLEGITYVLEEERLELTFNHPDLEEDECEDYDIPEFTFFYEFASGECYYTFDGEAVDTEFMGSVLYDGIMEGLNEVYPEFI